MLFPNMKIIGENIVYNVIFSYLFISFDLYLHISTSFNELV